MISLCVCVFLWLSCEVFASRGDGRFSVWSIQFMRGDRWVSQVSSINYISIFSPVKQRAETVSQHNVCNAKENHSFFYLKEVYYFMQHCKLSAHENKLCIHQGWFGSATRVSLHCCLSVTTLYVVLLLQANSTDWIIGHTNRLANEICLFPRLISHIRRMCLRVCERHEINAQEIANCFGAVIEDGCKQGG